MTIKEIAAQPRFNMSAEGFIEKYNKLLKDGNIKEEEIYDEIEEEVNKDFRNQI